MRNSPSSAPALWDHAASYEIDAGAGPQFVALGMLPGFFFVLAVGVTAWYLVLTGEVEEPKLMALSVEELADIATGAGEVCAACAASGYRVRIVIEGQEKDGPHDWIGRP